MISYREFIDNSWYNMGSKKKKNSGILGTFHSNSNEGDRNSKHYLLTRSPSGGKKGSRGGTMFQVLRRSRLVRVAGTVVVICFVVKFLAVSDDVVFNSVEYGSELCRDIMTKRLQLLDQVCDTEGSHLKSKYPVVGFFQTSREHETTVCAPHKVGSESWRYFFDKLSMRDRNSSEWKSSILSVWPEDVEANYVKAYQVRHPIERVLSAYRFVFEKTTLYLTNHLSAKILNRFGGYNYNTGAKETIFPDRVVTFKEFVNFLLHQDEFPEDVTVKGASSHWHAYHAQCNPCHPSFRPDFIIKLESALEDTDCYLQSVKDIDDEDYSKLLVVNSHPDGQSSQLDVKMSYFKQVTKEEVKGLERLYHLDHALYGYGIGEYLKLASDG